MFATVLLKEIPPKDGSRIAMHSVQLLFHETDWQEVATQYSKNLCVAPLNSFLITPGYPTHYVILEN
jgi:hypothetical protein